MSETREMSLREFIDSRELYESHRIRNELNHYERQEIDVKKIKELEDKLDRLESAFDELLFSDAVDQGNPITQRLCDTVNKLMGID